MFQTQYLDLKLARAAKKASIPVFVTCCFFCTAIIHVVAADDFSWIRGANYVPSYARNDVQTWMDYDAGIVDRDLGYAEKLKLNCVRVFLQVAVYERDPQRFLETFENFLSLCEKHRIQMMPVIFDSCFEEFPDLEKYRDKDWMACPGQNRLSPEHWPAMVKYVRDLVGRHKQDKRIVIWDVMNEPYVISFNSAEDRKVIHTFLGQALEMVRRQQPKQPLTIGWESWNLAVDTKQYAEKVDVIAFHNYTRELRQAVRNAQAGARKLGKPVIISEVVGRPHQGFQFAMPILREEKIGWCFWELMLARTQFSREDPPYQGLFYTNGMSYDPGEIASVMDISIAEAAKLFPQRPSIRKQARAGLPAHNEGEMNFSDGWTRWTGNGPRKGRLHYANTAGAFVTYEFTNSTVALIHKTGPDCGMALALVDGRPALNSTLDTYSASVNWSKRTVLATNLPVGRHVATIITLGKKNEKALEYYVQIVDFE